MKNREYFHNVSSFHTLHSECSPLDFLSHPSNDHPYLTLSTSTTTHNPSNHPIASSSIQAFVEEVAQNPQVLRLMKQEAVKRGIYSLTSEKHRFALMDKKKPY